MSNLSKFVGSKIKYFREKQGLTQDKLAELLNTSRQSVSRYETGERKANQDILFELAEIFNVNINDFFPDINNDKNISTIYNQLESPRQKKVYSFAEQELEEQNNIVSFPVYGKTAAGTAPVTYGDPDVEHKEFSSVPTGADVALVVSGDSMEPLISDGSIVFYKSQPHVENGEIAIVEIEGDGVTCKRVKFDYENKQIILQSENDKYEDMVFKDDQVRILGKVLL